MDAIWGIKSVEKLMWNICCATGFIFRDIYSSMQKCAVRMADHVFSITQPEHFCQCKFNHSKVQEIYAAS